MKVMVKGDVILFYDLTWKVKFGDLCSCLDQSKFFFFALHMRELRSLAVFLLVLSTSQAHLCEKYDFTGDVIFIKCVKLTFHWKGLLDYVHKTHKYYFAFISFRLGKKAPTVYWRLAFASRCARQSASPLLSASLFVLVAFNWPTNVVERMEIVHWDQVHSCDQNK